MSRVQRSSHELRCFCSRKPLLATYGLDSDSKLYVHVRVFKQHRIYGEVIIKGGEVKIHCRECLRWHRVIIKQPNQVSLSEDSIPTEIDEK